MNIVQKMDAFLRPEPRFGAGQTKGDVIRAR